MPRVLHIRAETPHKLFDGWEPVVTDRVIDLAPFADGSFDAVCAVGVLDTIPSGQARTAVREWLRVLTTYGFVFVAVAQTEHADELAMTQFADKPLPQRFITGDGADLGGEASWFTKSSLAPFLRMCHFSAVTWRTRGGMLEAMAYKNEPWVVVSLP